MTNKIVCVSSSGIPVDDVVQSLIVSAPDVRRLVVFYQRLGISFGAVQVRSSGLRSVVGGCPGFEAEFIAGPKSSREARSPLTFLVDDIECLADQLGMLGGEVLTPLRCDKSNSRYMEIADPDGRRITLRQAAPTIFAGTVQKDWDREEAGRSMASAGFRVAIESLVWPLPHESRTPGGLPAEHLRALRTGTGLILGGIASILIVAAASSLLFSSSAPSRLERSSDARTIGLLIVLAPAAVVQVYGKLLLLKIGTKFERCLLLLAISIEIVGVMFRLGALLTSESELAAMLFFLGFLSHVNELFLATFFVSFTQRFGTSATRWLSSGLFACTAAITGAVGLSILAPSSDTIRVAKFTLVAGGLLGFVLLVALCIALFRWAGHLSRE